MSFGMKHTRPARHSSEAIVGTKCDGCKCMEVIERKRMGAAYEVYWCSKKHGAVDPQTAECDVRKGWK